MNKREYRKQHLVRLGLLIASLVLISFISGQLFLRLDLTGDKRYTLSPATEDILGELDDIVHIRVYLDGDLPVGFRRLSNAVREMLDEFRVIAGHPIHYEFIDPAGIDDKALREDLFNQLYDKGLRPTNIDITERGGGRSQKLVFPGALVSYKGNEKPVNFLKNNPALPGEQNLNNSMQSLEYEIIASIHNLIKPETKKVAFLEGHGELDELLVSGVSESLMRYYDIFRGRINENDLGSLDDYDALIIAKPVEPFSEAEKYIIDQYIMKGGKVMWFVDPVSIDLDSLTYASEAVALINDINIGDQLFRYGVRLNPDLVMDLNCLLIPLNVALADEEARFVPAPWYFSPLLSGNGAHPVTKGLNNVKAEFASVVDTVGSDPSIASKVLLRTSEATRVVNAPLMVSLDMARGQPDQAEFNNPHQPVAVITEGEFPSVFANRVISSIIGRDDPGFRERGERTRMLVVADGDIIRNDVTVTDGIPEPLPLGYDRYSGQTFGNREFILNAVNYLLDEDGLMELRSRELQLRLLDRSRVSEERSKWQIINMILPLAIVIVFGLLYNWSRRKLFAYRS
ncbi:MAG: gliding motility-associated ABC transporter substrate-binding protein GldG [Bacteroidales bacterium]